ncbi:MAG: ZIP family metal transporter, partial [Candidatus Levybacteria bacterium]|nr:ZIP family metal transporter [Candidatus Levybacteria bacterium]
VALLGALITYLLGNVLEAYIPIFLALTAGFFIYIALSDLIPEIHHERRKGFALIESSLLILGVLVIWFSTTV